MTMSGQWVSKDFMDAGTPQGQAGIFLISELERLDPRLYEVFVDTTWSRDIPLRTDVDFTTEITSFIKTYFQSAKDQNQQINFQHGNSNTPSGVSLENEKIMHPFRTWAKELQFTWKELLVSQAVQRPIDIQKHDAIVTKYNMDIDQLSYVGTQLGNTTIRGLLNQEYSEANKITITGDWTDPTVTADTVLQQFNSVLVKVWQQTKFNIIPTRVLMPPELLAALGIRKVSEAGNVSIIEYLKKNSLTSTALGREIEIYPLKWLSSAQGMINTIPNRMVAYVPEQRFVRFPLWPIYRRPDLLDLGWEFKAFYYAGMGELEVTYPETIAYADITTTRSFSAPVNSSTPTNRKAA